LTNKGFSKKDILTFYAFRAIDYHLRTHSEVVLEDYEQIIARTAGRFRNLENWNEDELQSIQREMLSQLPIEDPEYYAHHVDPVPSDTHPQTVLNEISRGSSHFRDRHIFERIAQGLKTHNRIFVVYGSGHAVKQEPALRAVIDRMSERP
jgi:hypothetical protein